MVRQRERQQITQHQAPLTTGLAQRVKLQNQENWANESGESFTPLESRFQANMAAVPIQCKAGSREIPAEKETTRPNNTGLPDNLKAGLEQLSGLDMSDVRVQYNSSKPTQFNALAYTQGTNIHVGTGEEKHLPHEAWHVVQQMEGRVKPTASVGGMSVNNDVWLENEATVMGTKALQLANARAYFKTRSKSDSVVRKPKGSEDLNTRSSTNLQSPGGTSETRVVHQLIRIGKEDVTTVTALARRLGRDKAVVIQHFNTDLGKLPHVNEAKLNNYLNSRKTKVHGGNLSDPNDYIMRLANSYKLSYMEREGSNFLKTMATIESSPDYKTLVNTSGINYLEGEEDGASVKDQYSKALACSLYALLELKPDFLGATTPEELHYIFRLRPETKNYDEDKLIAKIRLSAGLRYRAPDSTEDTVSKFMSKLSKSDRGNKYIIDPKGEAHTFVLQFLDEHWKQVDNDYPKGTTPSNVPIRVIWTLN